MASNEATDELVERFQEITSMQNSEFARTFLQQHSFQLDSAIAAYMAGDLEPPTPSRGAATPEEAGGGGGEARGARGQPRAWPARVFGRVLRLLFGPSRPLAFGPNAAQSFIDSFERQFGAVHPSFVVDGYKQAVQLATAQSKFLLVYLHSPLHQDTARFCRQTLATAPCKAFIDEHFVIWGGSLEYSEPFVVSESIQSSGFPFMAVLLCGHSEGAHCLERIEGAMSGSALIERLTQSMQRHQANLAQIQQQQQRRQDSQQLRQEQNLEFERALQADREREAREQEERLRLERAEDEARNKAELEAALELSEKLDKEANLKRKRDRLGAEPPAGADTTKLRIMLPNGSKIDRKFLASETIEAVRDFIDVHLGDNDIPIETYSLSTNYPKRAFHNDSETLMEAGLHPQSVLYVQDLDA